MKLKLVVASMSLLSLICTNSALAADQNDNHKMRHHNRTARHHHGAKHRANREVASIPMTAAAQNPCPCPCPCECPIFDCYTATMDEMSQNIGRAKPTVNCNCPVSIAGGINFDWITGNRTRAYAGKNLDRFSLNDAYINLYGNVNCWTKAFMSLSYNNTSLRPFFGNASTTGQLFPTGTGEYSSVYNRNAIANDQDNRVNMEQAYITFANFNCSPFFIQLGKQFLDYGRYHIHPMTRSMVQVLTESLRTAAEVGFVTPVGINGSVAVFEVPFKRTVDNGSRYDFTAALGYSNPSEQCGYSFGIGYMYDMFGVNDVAAARNSSAILNGGTIQDNYVHRVSAGVIYGEFNTGPFSLAGRYTTALSRFDSNDFCANVNGVDCSGARPWAFDIDASYSFCWCSLNHMFYLSYQRSGEAINLGLPRQRWLGGFGTEVLHNTSVALELASDHDYSTSRGGTGKTTGYAGIRTSVKFG